MQMLYTTYQNTLNSSSMLGVLRTFLQKLQREVFVYPRTSKRHRLAVLTLQSE